MRILRAACGAILTCAAVAGWSADPRGQQPEAFSSKSELVVLNTVVTERGRPVAGLPRDAFSVFENGQPQPIVFYDEVDAPVTIGLLVDGSGSMRRNRDQLAAAVLAFAQASHPDDEFVALTFNERVTSMMPAGLAFTHDPLVLRDALLAGFPLRGRTALYDAVREVLDDVARGQHERKVVVVLSDGGDNASAATFDQTLARLEASPVMVYAIAIVDRLTPDANPKRLARLARATGGLVFTPSNASAIGEALASVNRDIRSGYTLAYAPADDPPDGRPRRLRVVVRGPDDHRYDVRTRANYMAQVRE
jgi:Ca-activated chloride channel family protein